MVRETDTEPAGSMDREGRTERDWSRRTVLRASGAGVGIATALGLTAAATQEDDDDENGEGNETDGNQTNGNQTDAGDAGAVFDDLVDPVWGYPLAADESEAVDVEPVVDLVTVEGEGSYPDFPVNPQTGEGLPFEFQFDPVGLHVRPGDIVKFQSTNGEHTATAFHEKYSNPEIQLPTRIPEDVLGFTSPPIVTDEAWLYEFSTKGVYDILCLPHLVVGMVMRVVVYDPEEDDIESETFTADPAEGLPPNVAAVLGAEELTPSNIVDAGSVAWGDLTLATPEEQGTGTETEGSETEGTETGETETEGTETEGTEAG